MRLQIFLLDPSFTHITLFRVQFSKIRMKHHVRKLYRIYEIYYKFFFVFYIVPTIFEECQMKAHFKNRQRVRKYPEVIF